MVRKKAAVCGEERCVTSLKTAAKETTIFDASFILIYHLMKTFTAVKTNEVVGKKV